MGFGLRTSNNEGVARPVPEGLTSATSRTEVRSSDDTEEPETTSRVLRHPLRPGIRFAFACRSSAGYGFRARVPLRRVIRSLGRDPLGVSLVDPKMRSHIRV